MADGPWSKYQPTTSGPWSRYQNQGPQVVMETADGRVTRDANGRLSFSSPAFSTNDPEKVRQIMEGATGGEVSRAGFQEQVIAANPVAARGATAFQGVPFVGSRLDEAASGMFGPKAGRNVLASQEAMQETRPGQSLALQLGAGVASAIPIAAATPVGPIMGQGTSLVGQVLRGAGAGAAAGAAEGAIYGSGIQEGGRGRNAARQALVGGVVGGVVGGAAPVVSRGLTNLVDRVRGTPEKAAGAALGVSPESARLLGAAVDADIAGSGGRNLARSGPDAMLADLGPTTSGVLDTAMQTPGAAARIGRERVEARAASNLPKINAVLDDVLGAPEGIATAQRNVREGAQDAGLGDLYEAAYSQAIDYSSSQGKRLEGLVSRLPARVVNAANELMRAEGASSPQIMASIADDGSVTFTRMPDVRQWDYIKRGLQQLAESTEGTGSMGGKTPIGRAWGNLAREIRGTLGTTVPAYNDAVETAADAITRQNAIKDGSRVLSQNYTRSDVVELVEGMTKPELDALKQGIRSRIDDQMARVMQIASDPNIESREVRAAVANLTSRDAREKLQTILGASDANRINRAIEEAMTSLVLKSNVSRGAQTAGRQFTREFIDDITAPGGLTQVAQARPIEAVQAIVQSITKTAPRDIAAKQGQILAEVADVLTRSGLPEARQALRVLSDMNAAQPIGEAQAQFVANAFTTALSGAAFQGGMNVFSNRNESGYTGINALR